MKIYAKKILVTFFVCCVVSLIATSAYSEFEGQQIFGLGATSASNSGLACGSRSDTLDYLTNPSLIQKTDALRYSLSLGSYDGIDDTEGISYFILSYAKKHNAYTLFSGDEFGLERTGVTYTTSKSFQKYVAGVSVSAYKFSAPSFLRSVPGGTYEEVPSDDGSLFTIDVGAHKELDNGIRVGATISNLLSITSEYDTITGRQEVTMPVIFNLGVSYPFREWLEFYAGYKRVSHIKTLSGAERNDDMLYMGAEYGFPGKETSARAGFHSQGVTSERGDDRSVTVGATYTTDKYHASISSYNYIDSYSSPLILTVSYKPDEGKWKEPYSELEKKDEKKTEEQEQKYEQPLKPAATQDKKEPGKKIEGKGKKEDGKKETTTGTGEKTDTTPATPAQAPTKQVQVADFEIDPKVIMIPASTHSDFNDLDKHWAKPFVESLAKDGFYPNKDLEKFDPDSKTSREEFYRLLFLTQTTDLFKAPVTVYFKTPYPVSGSILLQSSDASKQAFTLQEGTYERSGPKRLVINRDILMRNEVFPGHYKVLLSISNENLVPRTLEDYITVLDTSMDFSKIASAPEKEKKQNITNLKNSLSSLGINLDYLEGLLKTGGIMRIEALRDLFDIAGVKLPSEFDKKDFYTDALNLPAEDQSIIYLASRGMRSLEGYPLMGGYPDNSFKPEKEMTNAETAALIDRYRKLNPSDMEAPYNEPRKYIAPEPKPVDIPVIASEPVSEPEPVSETGPVIAKVDEQPVQTISKKIEKPKAVQEPQQEPQIAKYYVTSSNFLYKNNAMEEMEKLKKLKYNPIIVIENMDGIIIYHTAIKGFDNSNDAYKEIMSIDSSHFTASVIQTSQAPDKPAVKKPAADTSKTKRASYFELLDLSEYESYEFNGVFHRNFVPNIEDHEPESVEYIEIIQ
ncbi:MAG TPA: S-layer homology domain-containing protein [bacterium]|nr:S-layer homology domain-containing protein [bacterium]